MAQQWQWPPLWKAQMQVAKDRRQDLDRERRRHQLVQKEKAQLVAPTRELQAVLEPLVERAHRRGAARVRGPRVRHRGEAVPPAVVLDLLGAQIDRLAERVKVRQLRRRLARLRPQGLDRRSLMAHVGKATARGLTAIRACAL